MILENSENIFSMWCVRSGGLGMMDSSHVKKMEPKQGMLIVKLGGPAYKIGVGGGAASSMVAGDNAAELDFNAVQRGDAEMLQKVSETFKFLRFS